MSLPITAAGVVSVVTKPIFTLSACAKDELARMVVAAREAEVRERKQVSPAGYATYDFDPETDLIFDYRTVLRTHSNGMTFCAWSKDNRQLHMQVYFSIGGGFVVDNARLKALEHKEKTRPERVPYPFENADQMMAMAQESGLSIADMKRANEVTNMPREALDKGLHDIHKAMTSCVERGLSEKGELPGGLHVKRRSAAIHEQLQDEWKQNRTNPLIANDWLQVFAMAVNEENAAGGKVVTAPTNGAAGVIP